MSGEKLCEGPILRLGIGGSVLLALVIGWWYFLPTPLFTVPYSTVILDKEGEIMGMTVASDGSTGCRAGGAFP